MNLLETYGPFVKDQIHLQDQLAERYRNQEWRATKHQRNAVVCRALLRDLETAQTFVAPTSSESTFVSPGLAMAPTDLDGLPKEVLDQLNLSESETIECNILDVIEKAGGILTLNKILIGMFRKTSTTFDRAALNSRLHRMVARGRLYSQSQDRRGIFSTRPYDSRELREDADEPADSKEAELTFEDYSNVSLADVEAMELQGPPSPSSDILRRSRRIRM